MKADRRKLREIQEEIENISSSVERLKRLSGGVQAIDRNVSRIQASVKMLEINISDLLRFTQL